MCPSQRALTGQLFISLSSRGQYSPHKAYICTIIHLRAFTKGAHSGKPWSNTASWSLRSFLCSKSSSHLKVDGEASKVLTRGWNVNQERCLLYPTSLRLIITLPFHPQLINTLVTPCIADSGNLIVGNPIVTPQWLRAYIKLPQLNIPWFKNLETLYINLHFEHIEVAAKLLDCLLRSNQSHINQSVCATTWWGSIQCCLHALHVQHCERSKPSFSQFERDIIGSMTKIHLYKITNVWHGWLPSLGQEVTNLFLCPSHMVCSCPMTLLHQICIVEAPFCGFIAFRTCGVAWPKVRDTRSGNPCANWNHDNLVAELTWVFKPNVMEALRAAVATVVQYDEWDSWPCLMISTLCRVRLRIVTKVNFNLLPHIFHKLFHRPLLQQTSYFPLSK